MHRVDLITIGDDGAMSVQVGAGLIFLTDDTYLPAGDARNLARALLALADAVDVAR